MHPTELSVARAPYGLAFDIEDLVLVRNWADHRRLKLGVVLDWTHDGAEFEEMLILAPAGARRRTLTLWRTQDGMFAQTPTGRPHRFPTMDALLADIRPARPRRKPWLQRIGLAS